MRTYYVYIMASRSRVLYTGVTNDLARLGSRTQGAVDRTEKPHMGGLGGRLVRGTFPSIMTLFYRSGAVILSERAGRARAKDLKCERAERARAKDLLVPVRRPKSRSFAPAALRMTRARVKDLALRGKGAT